MIRTLDRYVASLFLKVWLVCVFGAPLLFIIIRLTDDLDTLLARGLTPREVLLGYLYDFPYQVSLSFPVAALFGAVFTVAMMSRHFEVTAAKASGVSFYRLIAPILILGALLSVAGLALGEVVPITNRMREEVLGNRASSRRAVRTQFVYGADGGRAYTIRRLSSRDGEIRDIVIDREGTGPEYPTYRIYAPTARWDGGDWKLASGYLRYYTAPDRVITFEFDTLVQRSFWETPEQLLAEPKDPEEMDYEELGRFIESIEVRRRCPGAGRRADAQDRLPGLLPDRRPVRHVAGDDHGTEGAGRRGRDRADLGARVPAVDPDRPGHGRRRSAAARGGRLDAEPAVPRARAGAVRPDSDLRDGAHLGAQLSIGISISASQYPISNIQYPITKVRRVTRVAERENLVIGYGVSDIETKKVGSGSPG